MGLTVLRSLTTAVGPAAGRTRRRHGFSWCTPTAPPRSWRGMLPSAMHVLIAARCHTEALNVADRRAQQTDVIPLEAWLASIIQCSALGILGKTPEGLITSWNAGAERLYGYSLDEVITQPASLLVPPDHLRDEEEIDRQVLAGGRVDHYETERLRKDGGLISVAVSASPIKDVQGGVVGISAIERDITDRKRAESALSDAEARFKSTFEDAPIGMALVSIDPASTGRLLQVNEAFCELTGYSRAHLETLDLRTLIHPEDVEEEASLLAQLVAGEIHRYEIETRCIHAERQVVWVLVTASLVCDDSGKPLYCIRQTQDIQERKQFAGHLEHLADHDALTGLFNRRRFVRELSRQMSYARRYGEGGAVLFLDLDNFKDVNDTLGHQAGDELIASVAHLLGARLRDTDVFARLGGDEFAVLLPRVGPDEAEAVADDLMQAVRKNPSPTAGRSMPLTVSVGIAPFHADAAVTADDLLIEADLAMYNAKETGRDRLIFASPEQQAQMENRLSWTERIRKALDDEISQYELLLRMPGTGGELLLPASFLYTAERHDLIRGIDRWVVSRAIQLIADARRAGRELCLEVNVSGRSVADPELPGFIVEQLKAASVDPAQLILEVTETAAIGNMDEARRFVATLADIGCRFALDDFGAGFGSFYYLKYLSLDYLKIDGEFIRNLPASTTDQLILRSIVQMANGLGKKTIAEFVGSAESLQLVRAQGVRYAQGYHVGRPRPLTELRAPVAETAR
ncbi:MAG: EAL domain-containing protein [Actinobacteria bacterium]|nr:MAG: EAL domain-containing protein [Actinomycetota bacterium]